MRLPHLLLCCLPAFAGCGSAPDPDGRNRSGALPSAQAAAQASVPSAAPAPPPLPERLMDDLDLTVPVAVDELREAWFAWEGQPVRVGAYVLTSLQTAFIAGSAELTDRARGERMLAGCELLGRHSHRVRADQPVVLAARVRGITTATPDRSPAVALGECVLLSVGRDFAADVPARPAREEPVALSELHRALASWLGREISVYGEFHGQDWLAAHGQTRVQLRGRDGEVALACHLDGQAEPPRRSQSGERQVWMRGALRGASSGVVTLDGCRYLAGPKRR